MLSDCQSIFRLIFFLFSKQKGTKEGQEMSEHAASLIYMTCLNSELAFW